MALLVRAFPVRCDRAEVGKFAAEMRHRSVDARRFYTSFGVRREAWFYQDTPAGALVIGVTDVADPVAPRAQEYAQTTEHFAAWFKTRVQDLSGIDPSHQPLGPQTTMIFDSSGAELPASIAISARIYPVKTRETLLAFADELRERFEETRAFYEGFGVPREAWFLQETHAGPMLIGVTALSATEKAREYAETKEPFAAWFKQRVLEVTGVDPNVTPLGPPSEQVFDFQV
jgi:hypothetical protein